jgi:3-phenylpropionate/trans-cinnamate dioxygenase ferredoxin reductase subunit
VTASAGGVVVVGAGLAGLSAARALRAQGYPGRIVLVGAEPDAPYDRPPLSKEFLAGTLPATGLELAAPSDADLDLEVRTGTPAVGLDPGARAVLLGSGERLGGDGVVIATGARARRLSGPAMVGVHTLRSIGDAVALRGELRSGARLVVVGAGFIGAEVASTARGLGLEVTVVEAASVPLAAALGEEMGAVCARLHADHGVDLVTGVGVETLVADGGSVGGPPPAGPRVRAVRLADGRQLDADVVLVGIGSQPNVEWLAGSGLDLTGGVLTDESGATAIPGVVATGDCCRRVEVAAGGAVVRQEHWTNALQHPSLAVAALLGSTPPVGRATERLPYFWSDQYGARLQFAGHRRGGDRVEVVEGSAAERSFVAVYRRDGAAVAVLAMNHPRVFGRWRRELAAALPVSAP